MTRWRCLEREREANKKLGALLDVGGLTLWETFLVKTFLIDRWWTQTMRENGWSEEELRRRLEERINEGSARRF